MIPRSDALALSASLNETPFLRDRRLQAYDMLAQAADAVPLPATLPLKRGEGCASALASRPFGERWMHAIAGEMLLGEVEPRFVEMFERRFGTLLPAAASSPELLRHYAFLTGLHLIVIEPDQEFAHPLDMTYTNTHAWGATHLVVIVGRGSRLTFIERLYNDQGGEHRPPSGDNTGMWSHCAEVFLEEGAYLEYVSLQGADPGATVHLAQRASVAAGAEIHWRNVTLGGTSVWQDLASVVEGMHGASSIDWIFYAKDSERHRICASNMFDANAGRGEITLKGVAEQQAQVTCNGHIRIGPGGAGTDTYLTEDMLMLDPAAKVDAVPGLQIHTNDVRASHSATVSRVTDEDLFYFASRGIPAQEARAMYVLGFLGDLTGRISDEYHRELVLEAIAAKFRR